MYKGQANCNTTDSCADFDLDFANTSIPNLQDDETLYGWCSRFHQLNVGSSARSTSRMLFGHPKAALWHDVPGHMGEFQQRTQGAFGDPRNLLRERTLFGFHVPFLTAELEENLLKGLVDSDGTNSRKQLGFEHIDRLKINALKWCPECVDQQLRETGFSWWQMSQQEPTALVCRVHGEWLRRCLVRLVRGVPVEFQTPYVGSEQVLSSGQGSRSENRAQMISLSKWSADLRQHADHRFTDAALRYCYLLKAKAHGYLAFDGTLRMHEFRDMFVSRYTQMIPIFGSEFFGDLQSANAGFLAYMFRQLPSRRHPLKHYLLINLLFESCDEFIELYRRVQDIPLRNTEAVFKSMLCEGQSALINLVAVDGMTVSHAAAKVGVSISSAAKLLDRRGVNGRLKRPHIVGTSQEIELINLLQTGRNRSEIAKTLGLRPAFIKDYLATRPELKKVWADAHWKHQIQHHRARLSEMLHKHSELPIKTIRRLPGNGFQWLYVNDREWLKEILPAIWKR
nr:TnsD family Tn7-like transposition protein [uncultured Rhodoferax sp.]